MELVTGEWQFSYTGRWKQANNALYMYEQIYKKNTNTIPKKFKTIDNLSRNFFESPHEPFGLLENLDATKGTWFTSFPVSPLRQYLRVNKGLAPNTTDFKELASFGPFYMEYGNY